LRDVTPLELLSQLNELDEHPRIENKAGSEIGNSILETICAFANGGHFPGALPRASVGLSLNTSKCTTNVRIKVHHLRDVFGYGI
jgi:hypothetical protein